MVIKVDDLSQTGEARRAATALANALGHDDTFAGRFALVVTEAATNLARHGRGGEILLRALGDGRGVEMLSVDRGPGMADPERCVADGYSTGGSSGNGLGAIRRIASIFDLYSLPGGGTVVLARLLRTRPGEPEPLPELGVVSLAAAGERVRGDQWAVDRIGSLVRVCVADGLGHGEAAHEAAARAVDVFRANPDGTPAELVQRMHLALRTTRGAAVAVAHLDSAAHEARFAGVGNIAALVVARDRNHALMSHNGIVGHELRRAQEVIVPWTPGSTLVMHSDGLQTRWRIDQYPGVLEHHPAVLAAVLQRDFTRGRDDVTVLSLREPRTAPSAP